MTSGSGGEAPRGQGEAVLVVDDVAVLRRVVARQMTDLGYRVFEAADGDAALKVLETEAIDLLFTDIVLGRRGGGFDLADAAQKRAPGLRVIFTSGFPDSKVKGEKGYRPGSRILGKPFRRDELARALREAIDAP